MAVADALTSRRVFKDAMRHERAIGIIVDSTGRHFDPDVVDAIAEFADEFDVIAGRYSH